MEIKAETLNEIEIRTKPFLDKGHSVIKPVWVGFFSNKFVITISDKPTKEGIEFNELLKILEGHD